VLCSDISLYDKIVDVNVINNCHVSSFLVLPNNHQAKEDKSRMMMQGEFESLSKIPQSCESGVSIVHKCGLKFHHPVPTSHDHGYRTSKCSQLFPLDI